jgi:hypothetical protein
VEKDLTAQYHSESQKQHIPKILMKVGGRVAVCERDGSFSRGCVRWIGSFDSNEHPQWVGIQWDDQTRGTNDGTHPRTNVRYFNAPPNSSSFVKLARVISPSVFRDEFIRKYAALDDLRVASLRDLPVGRILGTVEPGQKPLCDLFPKLVELDLSYTLIGDWDDVLGGLFYEFPNLQKLDLTSNRFSDCFDEKERSEQWCFKDLIKLELCEVPQVTSWMPWLHQINVFPNLKELNLRGNQISSLSWLEQCFPSLELLDLTDNCIDSWEEVTRFCHIQR